MNLNQITIPSKDLSRAISFYEKLGLELIVKSLPRYARFVCPDGSSTFSIHLVDSLPIGDRIVIYFECNNLDSEIARLQEEGIEFEELAKDQSWLWREARLKDPDGNSIKLYYAGENRINPPWKINKT